MRRDSITLFALVAGGDFESSSSFAENDSIDIGNPHSPSDMRLKPPMRGEVDKNDRGRNKIYSEFLPNWEKPKTLSSGDYLKGRNPNY